MEFIFLSLYDYFKKRKRILYSFFVVLFLLLGLGASRIRIEEDISKFFPSDKKFEKISQVFQNSKFAEKLVIMVSLKDSTLGTQPESLISFTEELVQQLQVDLKPFVKDITYRVDDEMALKMYDLIYKHLPVFLNENDFVAMDSITKPEGIKSTVQNNYRQLISPTGLVIKKMIVNDPIGISRIVLKKLKSLQYNEDFELYDNYFFTKDHRYLLFFVSPVYQPNDTGNNSKFLAGLDRITDQVSKQKNGVSAEYFGALAVAVGNAKQLRDDTVLTASIMILLMVVLLIGFLRKKRAPILILIPVLFGGLFSLAAICLIQGSISVLAIAAGSIVLGIAINYSLHFLSHLRETDNVRQVVKDLAVPMTLGSTTTVLAFLSLRFANASLLSDIGLFAGFSLIGAALCSLIFLPHLVNDNFFGSGASHRGWPASIFTIKPRYYRFLIPFVFVLTPLMLYYANDVKFNSDMSKLNFMSPKLKDAEKKLNRITKNSTSSVYLVADGRNLEEALRNNELVAPKLIKLKQQDVLKKYSSVSSFLISDSLQQKRISKWNDYWSSQKKSAVIDSYKIQSAKLKFTSTASHKLDSLLNHHYQTINKEETNLLLGSFFGDYVTEKKGLTTIVTLASVERDQINSFYKSVEHEHHVQPVDKRMMTNMFVSYVHADFTFIVTFTSILVFLILLISYGRIELTLITFIPMLVTWIWILGIMALLDIEFNIVNVMISTFIFGLGDDYSIFIMDGLQKEYKNGQKALASIQDSIFLSAITTISGLGVLIFAQHPALKSIAAISIIGIITVFIMSQALEPFLFSKIIGERAKKKLPPITFIGFVLSALIYSIFIFGSLLLTVIGFIFFKLFSTDSKRLRYGYHAVIQFFMTIMIFTGVPISKNVINRKGQYKRPMIIISNHQSFIDILLTAMQHPKVLLLTNRWVWNSPIFGWVVKMADYYPVDEGAEESVAQLRQRVNEGYSIMIFPEGRRTIDGRINRFHKGAFYLSEKLKLDILPLLIHGTGESIPKGDIYIQNAELTMKFLPPIAYDNSSYGDTYSLKAKNISHYFKEEYAQLAREIETPRHFRHRLISNYLYKGPVLEWYLRIKLRLENYYEPFHKLIPAHASVLDLGCGYGFLSYLLHFLSPERTINAVDYDEEKIAIANNGSLRGETLFFICSDIMEYQFEKHDVIIISDVLHYLEKNRQAEFMKRCFAALNPGGLIILRDGDSDLKTKHRWTKLTEFLSVTFMRFNKSEQSLNYVSGKKITKLAEENGLEIKRWSEQRLTSNVIFTIQKRT